MLHNYVSLLGGQNLGKNYIFTINIVKSVDERWHFLLTRNEGELAESGPKSPMELLT